MKKLSGLLLLAALGLFTCLGCGGGSSSSGPDAQQGTAEDVDPAAMMGVSDEELSATGEEGGAAP